MKTYQVIPQGISKKRTIIHNKPSKREAKLLKLSQWLWKNHKVYSFSRLKQRGPKLTEIRQEGLKHAKLLNV